MWWLVWTSALAEEAPPTPTAAPEEVIVWSNAFAQYDDTWWVVRTEVITPSIVDVGGVRRIDAQAWQLETVLHCTLDARRGPIRDADCAIEDAAIRAYTRWIESEEALEELATLLKGTTVQLQVNAKGRVLNYDLEGLPDTARIDRERAGSRRALVQPIASAFHHEPTDQQPGETWKSKHEPLLTVTGPNTNLTGVRTRWSLDVLDGYWVAQLEGRGTATLGLTRPEVACQQVTLDMQRNAPTLTHTSWRTNAHRLGIRLPTPEGGERPPVQRNLMPRATVPACPSSTQTLPPTIARDSTYALEISGVSIVDPEKGFITERVWSVFGTPTPSSPQTTPYWSTGSLVQIEEGTAVELGKTGRVAPPRMVLDDHLVWNSVSAPR